MNHVNLFIESSDFFTLDVAEYIGKSATAEKIKSFVSQYINYAGVFEIPEIKQTFSITLDESKETAEKYLFTAEEAGRIYRHVLKQKKRIASSFKCQWMKQMSPNLQ